MFDQRLIVGRLLPFIKEDIEKDPEHHQHNLGFVFYRERERNYQLEDVLLFDYLFAHRWGFVESELRGANSYGMADKYISAELKSAITEKVKINVDATLRDVYFDTPMYGAFFLVKMHSVRPNLVYLATLVPSESYDTCTMGWSAYDDLYTIAYVAPIDDIYYRSNPDDRYLENWYPYIDYHCQRNSQQFVSRELITPNTKCCPRMDTIFHQNTHIGFPRFDCIQRTDKKYLSDIFR